MSDLKKGICFNVSAVCKLLFCDFISLFYLIILTVLCPFPAPWEIANVFSPLLYVCCFRRGAQVKRSARFLFVLRGALRLLRPPAEAESSFRGECVCLCVYVQDTANVSTHHSCFWTWERPRIQTCPEWVESGCKTQTGWLKHVTWLERWQWLTKQTVTSLLSA